MEYTPIYKLFEMLKNNNVQLKFYKYGNLVTEKAVHIEEVRMDGENINVNFSGNFNTIIESNKVSNFSFGGFMSNTQNMKDYQEALYTLEKQEDSNKIDFIYFDYKQPNPNYYLLLQLIPQQHLLVK